VLVIVQGIPQVTGRSMSMLTSLALSLFFFSAGLHYSSAFPDDIALRKLLGTRRGLRAGSPDCGGAYQPCCAWGESCSQDGLNCVARDPEPICEPCGTPFAQPCPTDPYCEEEGLIPTTRETCSLGPALLHTIWLVSFLSDLFLPVQVGQT
jgi:hypothetical protein